jgi:hypothetical protein
MPFEGLIDEVCIYNRALTEEEIAAIYKTGSAGKLKTTTIVDSPISQMGYWGKNIGFDVTVKGAGLFSYQWFRDGVILPGATNQAFTLNDLKFEDAGNYWVQVTTAYGDAFSSPAILKVNPAGVSLGAYAGLLIDGVVGRTYSIQCTTNLKDTNSWTTLTNITLTEPKQLWLDTSADLRAPNQTNRIYQVKPSQ